MTRFLCLIALALAACGSTARNQAQAAADAESPPPQAAPADPDPVYAIRGVGQPGRGTSWSAVILDGRLRLKSPTSAGWYTSALSEAEGDGDRRIFNGQRTILTVDPGACAIREVFPALPDRVTLDWDGGRFEGCGGARPNLTQVAGAVWELVRIGDDPAPATRSPAATLIFSENGGVGGTLNCNDGGISATWTASGGFVAGREPGFMQTAIGCFDAGEDFGRRFWNAMPTARAWRRDGERLFITFADGTEAELRYLL